MLKVMRNSFQHLKWILVLVIVAFVGLVFLEWGGAGSGVAGASGGETVAARVNGETIPIREFERAIYFTQQNYEQMYGQSLSPEILQALNLPQQVLDSLVDRKLLLQEAEKLGLSATSEEVRKRILEIPVLNPDGQFVGEELYVRYVTASLGYSSASAFEAEIAEELTLGKLESALTNALVISPATAEAAYRQRNESAEIQYILYRADRGAANVSVTPAEIEAFYRENSNRYSHPDQRQVKYLLADMAAIRAQVRLSEAELRAEYERRKESFKGTESANAQHILISAETPEQDAAAKARIDSLHAELEAGADFAGLARTNSADPGSAARGGDLGWFDRGDMVPEFEQLAFSLPVGQLSDPFKTQYGYHIMKVNERRAAGYRSFEQVREDLERTLTEQRAGDQARNRIAQVRVLLEQSRATTDEQVRALAGNGVTFNDTGWFGRNTQITGIGSSEPLASWAFSADQGAVGSIIDTQRGPIVPWLAGQRPAGVAQLAEVRAQVESDVRLSKGRQAAQQGLAAAMAGGTFEQVASALGIDPVDASVSRQAAIAGMTGNVGALVDAALTSSVGETKGPVEVDQGAVAFRVLARTEFDPAKFAAEKDSFIATMRTNEARKLRASLLAKLRRESRITVNDALVQPPTQPLG